MPFYTFKCRNCKLELEELREMGEFEEPLCPECAYNPDIQGKYERMKKIIVQIAKPIFKGSGFHETDYKKSQRGKL